ncbi:MAG: hypothetical protein H0W23_00305 [Chloroflexia bacterium]|nr:hypothetical protein [Chloroflexia bacterium]
MSSNVFRFNVVDDEGAISFIGPAHGLKVLAAACSHGAENVGDLLDWATRYDQAWAEDVRAGLLVFDEHNLGTLSSWFAPIVESSDDTSHHPFRIMDRVTRARSMMPGRLGLVVINLKAKRIIQIHNSYADLGRTGRGRIRANGRPTRSMFQYHLPEPWRIVP